MSGLKIMKINEIRVAVGYECDLNCPHCYSVRSNELIGEYNNHKYFSEEFLLSFLQRLKTTSGLKSVVLTGGEPFCTELIDRTAYISKSLLENTLSLRVSTHGGGLTHGNCKRFKEFPNTINQILFQVSLDGAYGPTHDGIRLSPSSFSKAIEGIGTALSFGFRVQVRYTLTKQNISEFLDCYSLCNKLGVTSFAAKTLVPSGSGAYSVMSEILNMEDVQRLNSEAIKLNDTFRDCKYQPIKQISSTHSDPCTCGVENLHITAFGDAFPCVFSISNSRWRLGNIEGDTAEQILNNEALQKFVQIYHKSQCPGNYISIRKGEIDGIKISSIESGFPTALGGTAGNCVEAQAYAEAMGYPLVMKPTNKAGGVGLRNINTSAEIDSYGSLPGEAYPVIIEKFINGIELSVEVLARDGQVLAIVPIYKGETVPDHPARRTKIAPAPISDENKDECLALSERVVLAIGADGVCDVDIILGEDGPVLLEVNPRTSGSTRIGYWSSGINVYKEMVDMVSNKWNRNNVKRENRYSMLLPLQEQLESGVLEKLLSTTGVEQVVEHGLTVTYPDPLPRVFLVGNNQDDLFNNLYKVGSLVKLKNSPEDIAQAFQVNKS